ncbi:MAG: CRISPR-associated endonuclease Cas2 [Acidobacteriota bacterium]
MRCYLLAYDIRDPRRWRKVHEIASGYGEPLQYSVFQCILTRQRRVELELELREVIRREEDAVLIVDLGPLDRVEGRLCRLGAQRRMEAPGPLVI